MFLHADCTRLICLTSSNVILLPLQIGMHGRDVEPVKGPFRLIFKKRRNYIKEWKRHFFVLHRFELILVIYILGADFLARFSIFGSECCCRRHHRVCWFSGVLLVPHLADDVNRGVFVSKNTNIPVVMHKQAPVLLCACCKASHLVCTLASLFCATHK